MKSGAQTPRTGASGRPFRQARMEKGSDYHKNESNFQSGKGGNPHVGGGDMSKIGNAGGGAPRP